MKYPATANKAHITEIFSSIQGEGLRMGEKHLFIRFEECEVECVYCDERGRRGYPMTFSEVLMQVERLEKKRGPHSYISLTGGEPLLYLPFLEPLMSELKKRNFRLYLETNGILWRNLGEVIDLCDLIAMDIKPKSVTRRKDYIEEHRKFFKGAEEKDLFCKMVISKEIDLAEYERLIRMLAEAAPGRVLFLQPVSTDWPGHEDSVLMMLLETLQAIGQKWFPDIRIGVQFHKILNQR